MIRLPATLAAFLRDKRVLAIGFGVAGVCSVIGLLILAALVRHAHSVESLMQILFEEFMMPAALVLAYSPLAWGLLKGVVFHPVFDPKYSEWLARTPWDPSLPLPKGPLHIRWPEVAALAVFTSVVVPIGYGLGHNPATLTPIPALAFLIGSALAWTLANAMTGQIAHCYAAAALPVVFMAAAPNQAPAAVLALLLAAIGWHGVRSALRQFPTYGEPLLDGTIGWMSTREFLGWPYNRLLNLGECRVGKLRAAAEASLAGGWFWFLVDAAENAEPGGVPSLFPVAAMIGFLAAVLRCGAYSSVICDHFCIDLRLANRQWIVPKHDVIFVAPLLMFCIAATLPYTLHGIAGVDGPLALGLTAALVIGIGRGMGPDVAELQHTGVHSKFGKLLMQPKSSTKFVATNTQTA
ncbi:MAG: hypothetical protein AAGA92_10925 [Planctomycetota bacterium]